MDDATKNEAQVWLTKARRDLDSAKRLLQGDPPFRDTAAYHCQQAAEKALKAFLIGTGTSVPRTHDLVALVDIATRLDGGLAELSEAAAILTPYATLYRYPDTPLEPDDADLQEAVSRGA